MLISIYEKISFCAVLALALLLMGGCAGLTLEMPAAPLPLTQGEQERVGAAVEARLIQMLGGPYYDKALTADLKRICGRQAQSSQSCKISVADRSKPALYPLPGGHTLITRGLLADVNNGAELRALLAYILELSDTAYTDRSTRGVNEAINQLLSGSDDLYAPDSASIRLARHYKKSSCEGDCLVSFKSTQVASASSIALPESVKRLATLQPGYKLLASARDFEKAENQAQAIATYLQAATVTPDEPRILGSLGQAYLRAGQLQPARLHLQKAVKLQPDFYRTRMGLGYLYLKLGKLRQANQSLAESVRMLPATENLFLLAEAREKNGDVKGALSLYQLVVDSDPYSKLGRTSASRLSQRK